MVCIMVVRLILDWLLTTSNIDLLDVQGISAPRVNVNAIDQLYMKIESNKTLIKAICRAYRSFEDGEQYFFTDIIQGKGEGHIILLHGPPGTGKTLTAGMIPLR